MDKLGFFFTPIQYGSQATAFHQKVLEKVDDFLWIGNRKAVVILGKDANGRETVVLAESPQSLLTKTAKVVALVALTYFLVEIPLGLLIIKAVLRSFHHFSVLDPKRELEKGLDIPESTIAKIQEIIPQVLGKSDHEKIVWISKGDTVAFKYRDFPNLIFKKAMASCVIFSGSRIINKDGNSMGLPEINPETLTQEYMDNKIKAKEVCLVHSLDILDIPSAKAITVKVGDRNILLVAENDSIRTADKSIPDISAKAMNQVAEFFAQSNLNVSSLQLAPSKPGLESKVSLEFPVIDLKQDIDQSLIYVMNHLPLDQLDAWIDTISQTYPLPLSEEVLNLKYKRIKDHGIQVRLQKYYEETGIVTGRNPIDEVKVEELGLDLSAEGEITGYKKEGDKIIREKQTVNLKMVLEETISEIKEELRKKKDHTGSLQEKRNFTLNINHGLSIYRKLPITEHYISEENEKKLWFYLILQALVEKKYLFSFEISPYGYRVQA